MATMDTATATTGSDPEQEFEVDFEQSGHLQVDAALDRLTELPGLPLSGHAEVYDDIHQRLRGILAEQPQPSGQHSGQASGPGGQGPR
jgi:hypothetical protein